MQTILLHIVEANAAHSAEREGVVLGEDLSKLERVVAVAAPNSLLTIPRAITLTITTITITIPILTITTMG